jgi:hypothetical protein
MDFTVESYTDCAPRHEELAFTERVYQCPVLDLLLGRVLEVVDSRVRLTYRYGGGFWFYLEVLHH